MIKYLVVILCFVQSFAANAQTRVSLTKGLERYLVATVPTQYGIGVTDAIGEQHYINLSSLAGYGLTFVSGTYKIDSTKFATLFDISGLQTTLISGTNIKTINGASVLGSGNLVVTGAAADLDATMATGSTLLSDRYIETSYIYGLTSATKRYFEINTPSGFFGLGMLDGQYNGSEFVLDDSNNWSYTDNTTHDFKTGINNSAPAQALDVIGNGVFTGTLGASNLSGANTGDQDLSGYSLTSHTHTFASLTSTPTTIAGYGITDFNSLGDARWNKLSDTLSMLSHYIERGDTANMLTHFIERGDTLNMLTHYIERGDTSAMLNNYVARTENITGSAASLTTARTINGQSFDGTANISNILASGHPVQSLTNSTAADQDYSTLYTLPANYLTDGKIVKVTMTVSWTTGVSSATLIQYLKLGSSKVFLGTSAVDLANSTTGRNGGIQFFIMGTAAAGASVGVESSLAVNATPGVGTANGTVQPVNLATNGTLPIIFGITYSATGSTESFVLRTFMVEAIN